MAFLPLHAAGYHADITAGAAAPRTALDRVISSYTSTVRVLGYARQRTQQAADQTAEQPAVIVAMPDTDGADRLSGVRAEVAWLTSMMPASTILEGRTANRDNVLAALPSHPVAHFACHALSAGAESDASRLIVSDDATNPLTVGSISALDLPHAELAYLSACSTASPDPDDEAGHITSAFQVAGYRNVIGTLWPVDDRTASLVAREVYARLTRDGTRAPATEESFVALHQAVRHIRAESIGQPARWIGYVHVGI
jgi:CHAT domain-containing protein